MTNSAMLNFSADSQELEALEGFLWASKFMDGDIGHMVQAWHSLNKRTKDFASVPKQSTMADRCVNVARIVLHRAGSCSEFRVSHI